MRTTLSALLAVLLLLVMAPGAGAQPPPSSDEDEPTLLERLLIKPRRDAYTDADRRRAEIERSLPSLGTETPVPESNVDEFLNALLDADINQASPGQRRVIEKLHDPDHNRLPR